MGLLTWEGVVRKPLLALAVVAGAIFALPHDAAATIIGFEGVAPAGSLVNVNPAAPFTEGGFTLTPTTAESAVFDSAALVDFPGDLTDWFGFQENNLITLTGPAPFSLQSVVLGPNTVATALLTSITMVGNLNGGGTLSATFSGLTTATLETLNWSNLNSVVFRATDDSGIDNITLNAVPEPASLMLFVMGGLGLIAKARTWKAQDAFGR
jgi:hypothetical protein